MSSVGRSLAGGCALDVAHAVDLRADDRCLGEVKQEMEPGFGRERQDALCVIDEDFVHA